MSKLYRQGTELHRIAIKLGVTRAEVEASVLRVLKRAATLRRLLPTLAIFLLVGAVALVLWLQSSRPSVRQTPYRPLSDAVAPTFADDHWLLTVDQVMGRDPAVLGPIVQMFESRIRGALVARSGILQVEVLRQEFFDGIWVECWAGQGETTITARPVGDDGTSQAEPSPERKVDVLLIAREQYWSQDGTATAYAAGYSPTRRKLTLPAIRFDNVWFDALVCHELTHAYQDRRGVMLPQDTVGTDGWYALELEAHAVGSAVLDQATGGGYSARLRELAARHASARTATEFLHSVSIEEQQWLGSLFSKPTNVEAGMRGFAFAYALSSAWLEQRRPNATLAERVAVYREIETMR